MELKRKMLLLPLPLYPSSSMQPPKGPVCRSLTVKNTAEGRYGASAFILGPCHKIGGSGQVGQSHSDLALSLSISLSLSLPFPVSQKMQQRRDQDVSKKEEPFAFPGLGQQDSSKKRTPGRQRFFLSYSPCPSTQPAGM